MAISAESNVLSAALNENNQWLIWLGEAENANLNTEMWPMAVNMQLTEICGQLIKLLTIIISNLSEEICVRES